MTIIELNDEIKKRLRGNQYSDMFLSNCFNSEFLSIEEDGSRIIGVCFIGGLLHTNGIEIVEDFRGRGIGKKLLNEILEECKKRRISFLTGVFKSTNIISIKTHLKIGYQPVFSFYYNEKEGREIVVILPLNKKGLIFTSIMKIFNTKLGNFIFTILLKISKPVLKQIITFEGSTMPIIDIRESIQNFEKVERSLDKIYT